MSILEKIDGQVVKLPDGKHAPRLVKNKKYYCLMCGTTQDLIETQNPQGLIEYYCPACLES